MPGGLLNDPEAVRRLRIMKLIPLALLAAMAVLFIVTLPYGRTGWQGYFHAFAEAAMIGALADWFAVTALFRRPMGLPIPHTAIVPRRKDEIGTALARFVADNFMTEQAIRRRLAGTSLSRLLARWLAIPRIRRHMTRQLLTLGAWLVRSVGDEDVRRFLGRLGERHLAGVSPGPLAGQLLRYLTRDGRHQSVLTLALRELMVLLNRHREDLRRQVAAGSPWWLPGFIDDRIVVQMQDRIEAQLMAMALDPDHPMRHRFDAWLDAQVHRLEHDPEVRVAGERLKTDLLDSPLLAEYVTALWRELHQHLEAGARRPGHPWAREVNRLLRNTGRELERDAAMRGQVDAWLTAGLVAVVAENRVAIAGLISETVATWDAEATARRIELQIGRDLQFIRINGTLVGGLIGIALHTLVSVW